MNKDYIYIGNGTISDKCSCFYKSDLCDNCMQTRLRYVDCNECEFNTNCEECENDWCENKQ